MTNDDQLREQAKQRVQAKAGLRSTLVSWVLVTVIVLVVYFLSTPGGYFWPIWPILGVGIAVVAQAWRVFRPASSTQEARIQAEMDRLKAKDS